MSLCCCGNLKFRLSRSKSKSDSMIMKNDNKEINEENSVDGIIDKSKDNCSNRSCRPLEDHRPSANESTEDQIKVVMRTEPVRQKLIGNSTENANGIQKVHESRSSTALKSVFHKSIRFDEDNMDYNVNASLKRQSSKFQKPFVATSRRGSLYIFRNADDVIITPFAQILASLRKVRANFMMITNISSNSDKR